MIYHSMAETVLRSLSTTEGSFVHQVVARTGLDRKQAARILSKLFGEEMLKREKDPLGFGYRYFLKYERIGEPEIPARRRSNDIEKEKRIAFADESKLWHRVTMLKRMRDKLIEEHHPLLNLVIADYEEFLRMRENDD